MQDSSCHPQKPFRRPLPIALLHLEQLQRVGEHCGQRLGRCAQCKRHQGRGTCTVGQELPLERLVAHELQRGVADEQQRRASPGPQGSDASTTGLGREPFRQRTVGRALAPSSCAPKTRRHHPQGVGEQHVHCPGARCQSEVPRRRGLRVGQSFRLCGLQSVESVEVYEVGST